MYTASNCLSERRVDYGVDGPLDANWANLGPHKAQFSQLYTGSGSVIRSLDRVLEERSSSAFRAVPLKRTLLRHFERRFPERPYAATFVLFEAPGKVVYIPRLLAVSLPHIRQFPRELLRQLSQTSDIPGIRSLMCELETWLGQTDIEKLVQEELVNNEIHLQPLARRALLELLFEHDPRSASIIAYNYLAQHKQDCISDHFCVACVMTLRETKTHGLDRGVVSAVVRQLLTVRGTFSGVRTSSDRMVLRELILCLGVYGDPADVSRLFDLLEQDKRYEFGDQITSSLRKLLMKFPESVDVPTTEKMHGICWKLLTEWTEEHVICNRDIFAQASQVLSVLCSRLDPDDLSLVTRAVDKANDKQLALKAYQHVLFAVEGLSFRGHSQWIENHAADTTAVKTHLLNRVQSSSI